MDALLSEEFRRSDRADARVSASTCEEMDLGEPAVSDEVEDLRNSLREAVHDEAVQPKMQCLMMDPSFSMVTVQGEDSAIEWQTGTSRSATPWAVEPSPPVLRPTTPGSGLAGRIIFVMDEEEIAKRKKVKERPSSPKREVILPEDVDGISGRPELVEVSQPNVKLESDGGQDEAAAQTKAKDQRLFRLVSEGSEILNIMVPSESNLASVDEEESTAMVDNLSYLEETPATKTNEEYPDDVFESLNEAPPLPPPGRAVRSSRGSANAMDPPGAPVSRPPPGRNAAGNVDYFEKFTLIDGQAPGSPAVVTEGAREQRSLTAMESQGSEEADLLRDSGTPQSAAAELRTPSEPLPVDDDLTSDHLDDVFYGATDAVPSTLDAEDDGKRRPPRLSLKSSGSALFDSQEDMVLTPIYLPEGPAKIIDQILLEEPKAMAFMYTDLYEEATGCRDKDEDAESLSSEKSFHSRHSDREARGYLEMYVLKDETPALEDEDAVAPEMEAAARDDNGKEDRVRMLSQDSYDFAEDEASSAFTEEELTDFLRASDNSSPCDIDPFPQSWQDEGDAAAIAKSKGRRRKKGSQTTQRQIPVDKLVENATAGQTDYDDYGDEMAPDSVPALDAFAVAAPKPAAPPKKKADSAPKMTLDLTPLMPVEVAEEGEAAGGKEQREEEKEMASPAETADEGEDGDDLKRTPPDSSGAPPAEEDATPVPSTEAPADATDSSAQTAEGREGEMEAAETGGGESTKELSGRKVADGEVAGFAQTRVEEEATEKAEETELSVGEARPCPPAAVIEPAKQTGRCVIL